MIHLFSSSPYSLAMHVLQREKYHVNRMWWFFVRHPFTRTSLQGKPLVWTLRACITMTTGYILWVAIIAMLFVAGYDLIGLAMVIAGIAYPAIPITIGAFAYTPYGMLVWKYAKIRTRNTVRSLGVPIIAITGSYGKTSVKNMLVHIMQGHYNVLTTPKSYNTVFGLSMVVDLELSKHYDYFIAEMGAFKEGDIHEMCTMIEPDYTVITGLTPQHLERFGSYESIKRAKFEIAHWAQDNGKACYLTPYNTDVREYHASVSLNKARILDRFTITPLQFDKQNLVQEIIVRDTHTGQEYRTTVGLVGNSHYENLALALNIAHEHGVPLEHSLDKIKTLQPTQHRCSVRRMNGYILFDNAYSSNIQSMKTSMKTLDALSAHRKVFVTPGLVELGVDEDRIHRDIAHELATYRFEVIFVGTSVGVRSMMDVYDKQGLAYQWIPSMVDIWNTLALMQTEKDDMIVLIENDIPDNYH